MKYDSVFIERLRHHDELAFARFYEDSTDDFFRYVVSHYNLSDSEVHDILSDVYLKIWQHIEKYDKKYTFWQFVRTVLKNQCKDYFKKSKPVLFSHLTEELIDTTKRSMKDSSYAYSSDSTELFVFDVEYDVLHQTLLTLSSDDQELIHARYVMGYPYETIADIYFISADSARQKISRIIKRLQSLLAHTRE